MAQVVNNLPLMRETQKTQVRFLARKDPLEKEITTQSSILDCKISWTEEPGIYSLCMQAWQVALVVSASLRPYRLQPFRLPCARAPPDENTGVGCRVLLQGSCPPVAKPLSISPALAGRFLPLVTPRKPVYCPQITKNRTELTCTHTLKTASSCFFKVLNSCLQNHSLNIASWRFHLQNKVCVCKERTGNFLHSR